MKRYFTLFVLFTLLMSGCKFNNDTHLETPLIPRPHGMFPVPSSYHINQETVLLLETEEPKLFQIADRLKLMLDSLLQTDLKIQSLKDAQGLKNVILLSAKGASRRLEEGGYHIKVDRDKVVIQGQGLDGTFNGSMTLMQMILLHRLDNEKLKIEIPNVQIWDEPAFKYRGMHLDVGRHFFPISFVKKYLDIMALYKFNYFHWHLTEDQGWRIEIKQYPELTEKGAYRKEADGSIYGGFYTQDEIKEVVAYAQELNITVIPEIEMPGHSEAALACYPQYSCSGKPSETPSLWGVFENVYCAGNEATFGFLENVLDEVMVLFPGEYIHIGGDECPKTNWEKCKKCQKRIKEEGLSDEHELQSYFIKRIEKYLNAHGRKMIGWDEILEGGLAPEATVMSWRGMQGGIDAAKEEHEVIMTPTSYCYFDYYQAEPEFEPKAIGGYLPLSKVYAFNPIPDELNEEQAKFVIGGQANMWTEYMETEAHVEYMLLPRMLALSEVLWSKSNHRDFDDFKKRLQTHKKLLDQLAYNYSNGSYRLLAETSYDTADKQNKLRFTSEQYQPEIRYTLDGNLPNDSSALYEEYISPESSCTIQAAIFEEGNLQRNPSVFNYRVHKGIGAEIKLLKSPSWRYGGETNAGLLDGILGTGNFRDGFWTGFEGKDMIAEIDFSEAQDIEKLEFSYIQNSGAWILPPKAIRVYSRQADESYQLVLEKDLPGLLTLNDPKGYIQLKADARNVVSLKVVIESYQQLPSSHPYAGNDCWLFVDELVME
jgi:hexosaminidase